MIEILNDLVDDCRRGFAAYSMDNNREHLNCDDAIAQAADRINKQFTEAFINMNDDEFKPDWLTPEGIREAISRVIEAAVEAAREEVQQKRIDDLNWILDLFRGVFNDFIEHCEEIIKMYKRLSNDYDIVVKFDAQVKWVEPPQDDEEEYARKQINTRIRLHALEFEQRLQSYIDDILSKAISTELEEK